MKQARVRVALRGEGGDIFDFNTGITTPTAALKDWMRDSINLLNIAGQNVVVPDVGFRWAGNVYYLTIKGDLGES